MYVADVRVTPVGVARQGCTSPVFLCTVQAGLEKLQERFMISFFTKPMSYILSVAYVMCQLGQFIPVYITSNSRIEHLAALYIKKDEFIKSPDFWLFLTFGPCCHCIFCRHACSPHILSHCSLLPPSCLRAAYYLLGLFSQQTHFPLFSQMFIFPRPGKKQSVHPE